jgi:pimeloyl-ACP methyl ester carboxylesterase
MQRTLAFLLCCLSLTAQKGFAQAPRPDILGRLAVPKQTILVFGQEIAYYEAGQGRAVVLLSNLGWDSHAWSQNMPALADKYHVLAMDLLGTGQSAKPPIDYKMDTWTDFIAEFLRLKGIEKATIVGAVMGGALAVQFTLDHPEMSEGFVCAASNSGPGEHAGGVATTGGPSLAGTKRGLIVTFHDKSLITDKLVRARYEYRLQANDGYTIQRHLSDHRAPYTVQELSAIKVPALFVWCQEDEITPLNWGEDYAAAVPGARLAVLNGCGHLPNLEKPNEFNHAVLEFLRSQKD